VQKLDNPDRLAWTPPQGIVEKLEFVEGMTIDDIGAVTGFFAVIYGTNWLIARKSSKTWQGEL